MKVSIIKDIIIHPKKAFIEITEHEKEYFRISLIILGIGMAVGLLEFDSFMDFLVADTENKTIGHQFYWIISSIGGAFLTAWLVLKISKRIYKTQSNFKRVFSAIEMASIPYLMICIPIQIITMALFSDNISMENFVRSISIIALVSIPFIIWSMILLIMACKQSLQLNTKNVIVVGILVMIISVVIFYPINILLTGSPFQEGWFEI